MKTKYKDVDERRIESNKRLKERRRANKNISLEDIGRMTDKERKALCNRTTDEAHARLLAGRGSADCIVAGMVYQQCTKYCPLQAVKNIHPAYRPRWVECMKRIGYFKEDFTHKIVVYRGMSLDETRKETADNPYDKNPRMWCVYPTTEIPPCKKVTEKEYFRFHMLSESSGKRTNHFTESDYFKEYYNPSNK